MYYSHVGLSQRGIFRTPGFKPNRDEIVHALEVPPSKRRRANVWPECTSGVTSYRSNDLVSTLKYILESIPGGLIPKGQGDKLMNLVNSRGEQLHESILPVSQARAIIETLPPIHQRTLALLMLVLHRVLQNGSMTLLTDPTTVAIW